MGRSAAIVFLGLLLLLGAGCSAAGPSAPAPDDPDYHLTSDLVDQAIAWLFDNNGSRAIYHDGYLACTFGPFVPWDAACSAPRITQWDSAADDWELYDLRADFSQAHDLAAQRPDKRAGLQARFLKAAAANHAFPIGAGNWLRIHPEDRIETAHTEWHFDATTRRMPEFTAPGVGRQSTVVTVDLEMADGAEGVLYAVGGAAGGLTVYLDEGRLCYEYDMLLIGRYLAGIDDPLAAGRHGIVIDTDIEGPDRAGEAALTVDGIEVARAALQRTVPAAFSATESFDVGIDLGSPVSRDYAERRPFACEAEIEAVRVELR